MPTYGKIAEVAAWFSSKDKGGSEYQIGEQWDLINVEEEDEEWIML